MPPFARWWTNPVVFNRGPLHSCKLLHNPIGVPISAPIPPWLKCVPSKITCTTVNQSLHLHVFDTPTVLCLSSRQTGPGWRFSIFHVPVSIAQLIVMLYMGTVWEVVENARHFFLMISLKSCFLHFMWPGRRTPVILGDQLWSHDQTSFCWHLGWPLRYN